MEKEEHTDFGRETEGLIEVIQQLGKEVPDSATREDTVKVLSSRNGANVKDSRSEMPKVDVVTLLLNKVSVDIVVDKICIDDYRMKIWRKESLGKSSRKKMIAQAERGCQVSVLSGLCLLELRWRFVLCAGC